MILCGGQGTRLREYTELIPKPMVEIGGRPILWHIMKTYAHYGITEFILCLGYKGHVIKDYFLNYEAMNTDFTINLGKHQIRYHGTTHGEDGWNVTLVDTGEDAMTGARVKRAAGYLDSHNEPFLVTYGDGVANINISKLLDFHRSNKKIATMTGVRPPSRFGVIESDGGKVKTFIEKPSLAQTMVNGGYFCFEPEFLNYLNNDSTCVLEREPLEKCAQDGQLLAYEHPGDWQCMDTFRDWEHLQKQWLTGTAPWKVWK
jgi:glucose-1-phosphate cytidylyltransferase